MTSTPASTSTPTTPAKSAATRLGARAAHLFGESVHCEEVFATLLGRPLQVLPEQGAVDVFFVSFDDRIRLEAKPPQNGFVVDRTCAGHARILLAFGQSGATCSADRPPPELAQATRSTVSKLGLSAATSLVKVSMLGATRPVSY